MATKSKNVSALYSDIVPKTRIKPPKVSQLYNKSKTQKLRKI